MEDIVNGSYTNCHYNSESGYCSLQPFEKLNKKVAIIRDIIKNILEKKTPVIGKGSGKGIRKKSKRKSIEILNDDDDNDI